MGVNSVWAFCLKTVVKLVVGVGQLVSGDFFSFSDSVSILADLSMARLGHWKWCMDPMVEMAHAGLASSWRMVPVAV